MEIGQQRTTHADVPLWGAWIVCAMVFLAGMFTRPEVVLDLSRGALYWVATSMALLVGTSPRGGALGSIASRPWPHFITAVFVAAGFELVVGVSTATPSTESAHLTVLGGVVFASWTAARTASLISRVTACDRELIGPLAVTVAACSSAARPRRAPA